MSVSSHADESTQSISPVSWLLEKVRGIYGAEPIRGTAIPAILLAVALTVLPATMLLYNNRGAIQAPQPIIEVIIAAGLISAVLTLLLSRFVAIHVAGGIVAAAGYTFFSWSWEDVAQNHFTILALWFVLAAVVGPVVVWLLSNSRVIITLAGTASAALAVFMFVGGIADPGSVTQSNSDLPVSLAFAEPPEVRPNVYLFVLDGFARLDISTVQLARHGIELDLSEQVSSLEELDFVTDPSATSNYPETILSVPSTLNAEYHHLPENAGDEAAVWSHGTSSLQGENLLVRSLRDVGYDYWHSSAGLWSASACNPLIADVCLGDAAAPDEAREAIWRLTPLDGFVGKPDLAGLSSPESVVDDILQARETHDDETPYFVFSHIVSPHQPYRYETDCSIRDSSAEGTSLHSHGPEFRTLYADQADCVADELAESMERLVTADPDAMIVLMADHGSLFEAQFGTLDWTEDMFEERMAIFRMTRLPENCRSTDIAAQSSINTVEVLTSCIAGEEPDFIEPRAFLTEFRPDYNVAESDTALVAAK